MQTAITTAMISPVLASAERRVWQGIARANAALNVWQDWSDATFADVQPYLEDVLVNLAYLISYAIGALYGFCRQSLVRTWGYWLETAPERVHLAQITRRNAVAWVRVALLISARFTRRNLPRVLRFGGKVLGFALCVNW